jgi:hypothetical protein
MNIPPIASLVLFRDLTLKVSLSPELEQEVKSFSDKPQTAVPPDQYRAYIESADALAGRCVAFLDAEMARLTEARFSGPDPNSLKQKLLMDPRRQTEQVVQGLKQKLANEKQEWTRRIAKQMADVATSIEQQVETIEIAHAEGKEALVVAPGEDWMRAFDAWKADVFARWSSHLAPLVHAKTCELIQPDVEALSTTLGKPVKIELRVPAPMKLPTGRERPKEHSERFEVPTTMDTFGEMFKNQLSTVAMMAGMVVIPVIGSLMHTAAMAIRALVMGSLVAPIAVFAFISGRKQRAKLIVGNQEKAREKLIKAVAQDAKAELDRFKPDAERYTAQYCNASLTTALAVVEPLVAEVFETREKSVAAELAKAQIASDRVMDQLQGLRMLKSQLSGQLVVDIKRRIQDLDSWAQNAAAQPAPGMAPGAKA